MINSYTEFCESLSLPSDAAVDMAVEIFNTFLESGIGDEKEPPAFILNTFRNGVNSALTMSDSDQCGDPEHIMLFVEAVGAACKLDGQWGLTWAYSADRHRAGAFSGGACVIDFDNSCRHEIDCGDWVETLMRGMRAA